MMDIKLKDEDKRIVELMTLDEKVSLCSGLDFWNTKKIERLGIDSIKLNDGSNGVRATSSSDIIVTDNELSTCFPTESAIGSSFNEKIAEKVGETIADECKFHGVNVILGPGMNMKRTPLGGRNFEYYSEDPYLTGKMASAFVNGVQKNKVGACVKHFVCNETEFERMTADSIVDEKTLREIYLKPFEMAIKESNPFMIMSAYNKLNNESCSSNKKLLSDILRKEWEYDGAVVSDWGAVCNTESSYKAGLDLEMPGISKKQEEKLKDAVQNGSLTVQELDEHVIRIVELILKTAGSKKDKCDFKKHYDIAKEAEAESIVLLKNDKELLPFDMDMKEKIAVIGMFAKKPRFQGEGSAKVSAYHVSIPFDEIQKRFEKCSIKYAQGYKTDTLLNDETLLKEAVDLSMQSDIVITFLGTTNMTESEGIDRKSINLPKNQEYLLDKICELGKKVVVVLNNGSAIAMPWLQKVDAVIEAWLGGEAMGDATADILCGMVNPSGKLEETFPVRLEDTPPYVTYPSANGKLIYGEGVFTGYRYYDARKLDVLFPFGYGLSYTTFELSDINISKDSIYDYEKVDVEFNIKNTGKRKGKETVQLYTGSSFMNSPEKELKRFKKIELKPEESKKIKFTLSSDDFSHYNISLKEFDVQPGTYKIFIGTSSRDIKLIFNIKIESSAESIRKYMSTLNESSKGKDFLKYEQSEMIFKEHFKKQLASQVGDIMLEMPLSFISRLFPNLVSEKEIELMLHDIKMK